MHNRLAILAAAAAVALPSAFIHAGVTIEQIEAYEDASAPKSHYAPIDFSNVNPKTIVGGSFDAITFHALDATNDTLSNHAQAVGNIIYGAGGIGHPFVTDVYAAAADTWIPDVLNPQNATSASAPAPGHFDGARRSSTIATSTAKIPTRMRSAVSIS